MEGMTEVTTDTTDCNDRPEGVVIYIKLAKFYYLHSCVL